MPQLPPPKTGFLNLGQLGLSDDDQLPSILNPPGAVFGQLWVETPYIPTPPRRVSSCPSPRPGAVCEVWEEGGQAGQAALQDACGGGPTRELTLDSQLAQSVRHKCLSPQERS
jgi:hypothetical protein